MERKEFINEKEPEIHGDAKWYRDNLVERMRHAYMKIDGSYDWPNSEEGDLLRLTRQMLVVMDQEQQN
ncbi:hypothetical protein [Enterococcus wangshanyuanii]|uniref:Uncharacterized protein n=1 Tax=Enterococcus wangshanyuanii TaxID=2005703 RepID=A0ABQ1PTU6_9ENTE|nr:hypothetical protein [Enterococcus wangshanyuanii]GGD03568.1 hypothetical protein GCM10011573_36290 [Enterococcus wangshanyuanii]